MSETERVVGKWIDDKPIYERVFTFTTFKNIRHELSIDTLVAAECIIKSDQGQWRNLPWLYGNGAAVDGNWHGGFYLSPDGIIAFQTGTEITKISYGHIILRYTKPS